MTSPIETSQEKTLQIRARAKKNKPKFVRQESWKYVRLRENWRRPRGLDNKVRKRIKGWPPRVASGYRGPRIARGLHPSGLEEVLIYNAEDIEEVDSKTQAIRIGHTVGKRKRARILGEARKKKIVVLNLREAKGAIEKPEEPAEEIEKEEPEESEAREETERSKKKEESADVKKRKKK
jgi:large subunit ribosomal protein L32e